MEFALYKFIIILITKLANQILAYSGTSRERPPLMSGLIGRSREVVAYGKFH